MRWRACSSCIACRGRSACGSATSSPRARAGRSAMRRGGRRWSHDRPHANRPRWARRRCYGRAMKAGRVIDGDEHDARALAQQIVDEARAEADRLRESARAEIAQTRHDTDKLAKRLVQDARVEAERTTARAAAETERLRDHARALANRLVEGAREPAHPAAGTVDEVVGLVMRATVPGVALGEIAQIDRRDGKPLLAEVIRFRGDQAVLLPLGDVTGVAPAGSVWQTGAPLAIRCAEDLLRRVLDGIGRP